MTTDATKAERVWKGLLKYTSPGAAESIYHSWLSELPNVEKYLLQYAQYVFAVKAPVDSDYSNAAVLKVAQLVKKVHRERHRMEAFVRFQLTGDGLFYAVIAPDFNVLPLLPNHFKNRYADQRWLIYDEKRKYGLHYDLETVEPVEIDFAEQTSPHSIQSICNEDEAVYQSLWQHYFRSVNIAARKNTKLHLKHVPKRYWKYLPEKQSGD